MNLLGLQKAAHTIFSVPHLQVCLVGLKELMTNTCRTGFVMKQWSFCCHQRKKTPRFPDVRFEGGFPSIGKACTFVLMRVECWKLFDKSGTTLRGVKLQKYKISWKRAKKSTTQSTTDGKAVVSNFERAKHRLRTMTERYGFSFFKIASISRHDADSRQPTDWQSIERTLMHVCIYI